MGYMHGPMVGLFLLAVHRYLHRDTLLTIALLAVSWVCPIRGDVAAAGRRVGWRPISGIRNSMLRTDQLYRYDIGRRQMIPDFQQGILLRSIFLVTEAVLLRCCG